MNSSDLLFTLWYQHLQKGFQGIEQIFSKTSHHLTKDSFSVRHRNRHCTFLANFLFKWSVAMTSVNICRIRIQSIDWFSSNHVSIAWLDTTKRNANCQLHGNTNRRRRQHLFHKVNNFVLLLSVYFAFPWEEIFMK